MVVDFALATGLLAVLVALAKTFVATGVTSGAKSGLTTFKRIVGAL